MNFTSTNLQTAKSRFSRISWGAVIAGALVAITISFLLNLLGIGIGLTSTDPFTDSRPFDGLATATLVWWILSNLASLFVGGLVAARAAGFPSATDGGIHGFLAWGLYLMVSILLITSITGSIFSGIGSLVSSLFGDNSTKEIVLNMKDMKKDISDKSTTSIESIKNEMFEIIEIAENYNILPNDSNAEIKEGLNMVEDKTTKAIKQLNLKNAISDFVNDVSIDLDDNRDLDISVKGDKDYINKEELKSYITNNTGLSDSEINGVINKWDAKIDKTIEDLKETYEEAKEDALKASEEISESIGEASIYLFFILFLGALAAFLGGATGVPAFSVSEEHQKDLVEDRTEKESR